MSNTFLDKIGKMVYISCKASSDETGTADYRQGDGIYRTGCSARRRTGDKTNITCWRRLSLGQSVNLIVMY